MCIRDRYYSVAITQLRIPPKNSTAFKDKVSKNTLTTELRSHGKDVNSSIKSDDSKDSGYGRSPVPPVDIDNETSPIHKINQRRGKNIVVAIGSNGIVDVGATSPV